MGTHSKTTPLLTVNDLSVAFHMYGEGVTQHALKVISDLSITANQGEVLAIAGSSGSGKSLLAHAIMGLLPANAEVSGEMIYKDKPLTPQRKKELRGKDFSLIPQSVTFLDPLMKAGKQARGSKKSKPIKKRQQEVFERMGLPPTAENLYPFQLSGGMARRVLFSTAIIDDADIIIADEPTPGMHLEQALEALLILRELADSGKTVILITHDIDLAFNFADRISVFYAGATIEEAPVQNFIDGPSKLRHPYSKALWRALPQNDFKPIPGFHPYAGDLPSGCLFAPRCPQKTAACEEKNPAMRPLRDGFVRCLYAT